MSYASTSDVAALTPGLISGSSAFSASTTPTDTQVQAFLNRGYARINAELESLGYSAPMDSGATIYTYLVDLEANYGAARAETVRRSSRVGPQETTRAQMFMDDFEDGLEKLATMDLTRGGADYTSKLYAGGISVADKDSVASDSDRVTSRFNRGQFRAAGTSRPSGASGDGESE
jgi:hypothetical protein